MFKWTIPAALLVATSATASSDLTDSQQFRPKDECIHVQGYLELRRSFEDIVRKRDGKSLYAMIAPDIMFEIGGVQGRENFAREWKLASGKASPIWAQLDKIIRLGCFAESDRGVMMPHMTALNPHWNSDRVSPKALVLGEFINLRAAPGTNTASRGLLSWEFVQMSDETVGPGWIAVKTRDGKPGYVHSDYLRSHLDYSINFQRDQNGVWTLNGMTAGD